MHSKLQGGALILALAFAGAALAQGGADRAEPDRAVPDPALTKAMARAAMHNKRVLVLFVDDGQDLATAWKRDGVLRRPLSYEFEIAQFAGGRADAVAAELEFPAAKNARPALAVLAADGEVRERIEADAFTSDGGVVAATLLAKLKPHHCAPVDAEKKLAAALVEAKKTGRNVFVRFDAPW